LGELLGRGGNKDVFAYMNTEAVGILRIGKSPALLSEELSLLRQLDELGLPTVNARGPISVDGQPGLLFDRFAQGSKDIVRLQDGKIRIVGDSPLLNQRSVSDLQGIRQTMVDSKIKVDDLQFLIGRDGRVVVADPLRVQVGVAPSKNNLRMIDLLIQQGQKGNR
jgi:filamentous hemagglutinin